MTIVIIIALSIAICKWIMWRWYAMAILLYYAESGTEIPNKEIIQKYSQKVAFKELHIKED